MSPATITLLFLLFAVVMFVWEKIPLGVTSMIVRFVFFIFGLLIFLLFILFWNTFILFYLFLWLKCCIYATILKINELW